MYEHLSKLRKFWRPGGWVAPTSIATSMFVAMIVLEQFGFGLGVRFFAGLLLCFGLMYGLALSAYLLEKRRSRS